MLIIDLFESDLASQLALAREQYKRLRNNNPYMRINIDFDADDETVERKMRLKKLLAVSYSKQIKELAHRIEEIKAQIKYQKQQGKIGSLFVNYSSQKTNYERQFYHDIGKMINTADGALEYPAKDAIDSFVGHLYTKSDPEGGSVGIMSPSVLENAYSNNPSSNGLLIRQQLESAFAPIRQALKKEFGDTIVLYRAQEHVAPDAKHRNVLSWTGIPEFADFLAKGRNVDVLTKEFSIDDIVWITHRANQAEFIMKNNKSLKEARLTKKEREAKEAEKLAAWEKKWEEERIANNIADAFKNEVKTHMKQQQLDQSTTWDYMDTPKGKATFSFKQGFRCGVIPTVELHWLLAADRGAGRAAMKIVCDLADKYGVTLQLFAIPMKGMQNNFKLTQEQLTRFYKSFGFEIAKNPYKENYAFMVRSPK